MLLRANRDSWRASNNEVRFVSSLRSIPSMQLPILKHNSRWRGIAAEGLHGMHRRAKQLEQADALRDDRVLLVLENFASYGSSWYPAAVEAMVRHEDWRRLTRTAIAVKQFQQQEGRWPTRLAELNKVSLVPTDWTTVSYGTLGYDVDGETAWVWSYPDKLESVPPQRPEYTVQELDMREAHASQFFVEIR